MKPSVQTMSTVGQLIWREIEVQMLWAVDVVNLSPLTIVAIDLQ
jgi:hypothetical protein